MKNNSEPNQSLNRQIARMDKNLHFLTLKFQYEPSKSINLKEHMLKINAKINALNSEEQTEWSQYILLKCLGLQKARREKEMMTVLRMLIEVCNKNDIRYEGDRAQGMLKAIYYQKYGNEILQLFKEAGYSISQFQILEYQDPWYTRLANFFSNFFQG